MQVEAYQHGIYPRSERVVAATRDLDRGRTTVQHVNEEFTHDERSFVITQRKAGLDYISDGMLGWQDMFRPFVNACDGLEIGPLTRWFDNNSFFRAPVVTGRLSLTREDLANGDRSERTVACLPSPYAFARAAVFNGDRDELMIDLARTVLGPVAAAWVDRGAKIIHLEDPWLVFYGISSEAWSALRTSLEELRSGFDATVVFHTYFGDAAPVLPNLERLPVDAIGIDMWHSNLEELRLSSEAGILLGCLDGRSSLIEKPQEIARLVVELLHRLEPARVFLSSNSDLELLPQPLAERKVRILGEVASAVRGELP